MLVLTNPVGNCLFLVLHCRFRARGEGEAAEAFLCCRKYIRDDLQSVFQEYQVTALLRPHHCREACRGPLESQRNQVHHLAGPGFCGEAGELDRRLTGGWRRVGESTGGRISLPNVPDSGVGCGAVPLLGDSLVSGQGQPVARSGNQSLQSH